ncbi:transcriptional regulator [Vibrio aquaticus]|uniref:Transcriptional regulator n=1 Tax=Vibrio aquaticus TaxID=2496559 RepID=A0A432CT98_9VIBR|nr:Rho-binding antiterminator [Vibrio aquaticus]RTZ14474.1 transcriptional regulator [Vibrio aquaticus]
MISCSDYDYIEIVCMHRYPVRLTMKEGDIVKGRALDTARDEAKQECVIVAVDGCKQFVVLDSVSKLEVLEENPHFNEKRFD